MSTTPDEAQSHAVEDPATDHTAVDPTAQDVSAEDETAQGETATDEALSADGTAGADDEATASPASGAAGQDASEELVREGEIAADFLETLLDIADLDGDLEVDVEGERLSLIHI